MIIGVERTQIDIQPGDREWESRQHDFMMNVEVTFVLLIDVNIQAGVLFFLN